MNKCTICGKDTADNWRWGDEPAHRLCVIEEAETACDNMCCLSILEEEGEECECGLTLKRLTEREKKALMT